MARPTLTLFTISILAAGALAGCASDSNSSGGDGPTGSLQQAGSSTVLPIAIAWAEELSADGILITVAGGGSGAGASKLCAKEVDLGDMSRRMKQSEIDACKANGVDPVEWTIAYDGLSVVVSKDNTFVDHLTVEELARIWAANSTVRTWADVRAGWPAEPIELFGADSDSGTYEYFNEEVLGKTCGADGKQLCTPRTDYSATAEDTSIVRGVAGSEHALGYFGYSYLYENQEKLRAVPIIAKGATAAVTPSFDTIRDGSYKPFSRPLFIYTDGKPAADTVGHAYLEYAYGEGQSILREEGFVELEDATLQKMRQQLGTA